MVSVQIKTRSYRTPGLSFPFRKRTVAMTSRRKESVNTHTNSRCKDKHYFWNFQINLQKYNYDKHKFFYSLRARIIVEICRKDVFDLSDLSYSW